jgi:hypothetical protein
MMGLGSGAGGVDVADVFSTDLYTGNASTQDIVNGLDLSTDGGMVWFARRNGAEEKNIFSTNAPNKYIRTTSTAGQGDITTGITAYNTDGFSLGGWNNVNGSGDTMVSWSWRQAPKWFDIVEYTGDNTTPREIAHNLGSDVGMIVIKCLTTTDDWVVYHRGVDSTNPEDYRLTLNANFARESGAGQWAGTAPTSTHFTIGNAGNVNTNAKPYVAYVFAHNESLIQCGSYTTNGSNTFGSVDLGWQPQFLMVKAATTSSDWFIFDAERGMSSSGNSDYLEANTTNATANDDSIYTTSTGFTDGPGYNLRQSNHTYIYMAIKAED